MRKIVKSSKKLKIEIEKVEMANFSFDEHKVYCCISCEDLYKISKIGNSNYTMTCISDTMMYWSDVDEDRLEFNSPEALLTSLFDDFGLDYDGIYEFDSIKEAIDWYYSNES